MYYDLFFGNLQQRLDNLHNQQRSNVEAAAKLVAEALSHQGIWAVMDTGHLLQHEARIRAGGLIALTPFAYELKLENDNALRHPAPSAELEIEKVRFALAASNLKAGDVLLINSNSGRTTNVIEAAIQCRMLGINTIGLASTEQMNFCTAAHPSGKKLHEVVDVAVDNCAPLGDASVPLEGNEAMCPLSGILSACALWAIQAAAVSLLEVRGLHPSIYRSVHISGQAFVDEQVRQYRERGL